MTEALRLGKKAFTWGVVVSTIAWSVGVAALVTPLTARAQLSLTAGALIRGSLPAVYYYGSDGKRYVFPNEKTYSTWYSDFSGVQTISDSDLGTLSIGGNVVYRAGTRLVKIQSDPKTYVVEPGGKLRHITSEAIASALYGSAWNTWIDDVSDAFFVNYTAGDDIVTNSYPTGTLVKTASSADIWYIDGTSRRKVTADGMTTNRFRDAYVVTTTLDITGLTIGTDISVGESALTDTAQLGVVTPPVSVGTGLSVALASDSPAAVSIVTDNVDGGQALVGALKVRLTASADGSVTVTGLNVTRGGISSDADIQDAYLFDGDTMTNPIARTGSISSGLINFSNTAGLFTIAAGATKDVMVRYDVGTAVDAGKTISISLAAANVTVSGSTTVTGSASGNTMTVASVTDLGQLEMINVNPTANATIDPQNDFELWRFRFDANDEDLTVKYMTITNVGSIDNDDIQNFKLYDGTTQLGSTITTLTDGKLVFDFTSLTGGGYTITSGISKQLSLRGDILGGTNRQFRFTIREATDVVVFDTNYNVYTRPVKDATETFSVIEPNTGGTAVNTTISTGKLTIQKASDSPSSNVPDGATNVLLAKWNLTAAGEDVKVSSLVPNCNSGDGTTIMTNVKLVFDGSQVGTTDSTETCDNGGATTFTFGNSFIVPVGTTKVLAYYADLTDATVAADDTVVANLETGASNAEGRTSLNTISTSSASGNTVTVKAGAITVTENVALPDYSATRPTGVLGSTNAKIASFVLTGGGEDADVTQIVLTDDMLETALTGDTMADIFQNLKLKKEDGTQVGTTFGSLTDTDSTNYTFTPSTAIRVVAGGTVVIDVWADIKSSHTLSALTDVNNDTDGVVIVASATGSGVTTGTDVSDSNGIASLQVNNIATNGNLRVSLDASAPIRQTLVMGHTSKELARFKLEADVNEDINVTKIVVSDSMMANTTIMGGAQAATGTLRNFKLLNASTGAQIGGTIASLDTTSNTSTGSAIFDNISGLTVPKNGTLVFKVVADLTTFDGGGVSSSTHKIMVMSNYTGSSTAAATALEGIVANGKDSGFQISGTSLDFNETTTSTDADAGYAGRAQLAGNQIDVFRTKLTVALASDSPSGTTSGASEQTVAKFVFTNSMNSGSYAATLQLMNLDIGSTISNTAARSVSIYKDSVTGGNQLATTGSGYCTAPSLTCNFADTNFLDANFTDTEISGSSSADSTRTFIVTADTSDAATDKRLTVGLDNADLLWGDGTTTSITLVESLPVAGRTLSY